MKSIFKYLSNHKLGFAILTIAMLFMAILLVANPVYAYDGIPIMATIMEDFGTTLLAWLDVVLDLLIGSFEGVVPIFWSSATGFTIYGLLMLFGLVVGFVGLALGFIVRLIQK